MSNRSICIIHGGKIMGKKRVALVLSGGAALGCAHIGVIKVLQEHNIPIDIVVGTSMGGVVGAGYAVGLTYEEMAELATNFRTFNFLDLNFDISGMFSGKGVMKTLNKFLPDGNIEDLPIKFACVASDLIGEQPVVFDKGPIRDAVRATISIPGVFSPIYENNRILVDGGILNNMPEDVAVQMGADIIISCDVLNKFKISQKPKTPVDAIMYSMILSAKELQKFKSTHADLTITPNMMGITPFSFTADKSELAIKRGERAAKNCLDEIKKLVGLK